MGHTRYLKFETWEISLVTSRLNKLAKFHTQLCDYVLHCVCLYGNIELYLYTTTDYGRNIVVFLVQL